MKENEKCHYSDSIFYAMEQAVVYLRVKGAQFFNQLDIGITIDQFAVLDAIYCNNDICQRDLSKLVLKDRSNTGRILNILEENGFIKRVVETKGKRLVKKVYMTEKGKVTIEELQPKLSNAFSQLFDAIPGEEFDSMRTTLSKLKKCLSETTSIQI